MELHEGKQLAESLEPMIDRMIGFAVSDAFQTIDFLQVRQSHMAAIRDA